MVAGISTGSQATYVGKNNNSEITANTNTEKQNTNDIIEDTYIPSFDFNNSGAELYSSNWNNQDFGLIKWGVSSCEDFKSMLQMQITQDYRDQHPNQTQNDSEPRSLEDRLLEAKDGINLPSLIPEDLQNYLDSIDYKKEFNEYLQSRGCGSEAELQALNQTPFHTKSELLRTVAATIDAKLFDMNNPNRTGITIMQDDYSYGITPERLGANFSLGTLSEFWRNTVDGNNFSNEAEFNSYVMDFVKEVENRKVGIKEYYKDKNEDDKESNDIPEQNLQKYNSSLIAKYAS